MHYLHIVYTTTAVCMHAQRGQFRATKGRKTKQKRRSSLRGEKKKKNEKGIYQVAERKLEKMQTKVTNKRPINIIAALEWKKSGEKMYVEKKKRKKEGSAEVDRLAAN